MIREQYVRYMPMYFDHIRWPKLQSELFSASHLSKYSSNGKEGLTAISLAWLPTLVSG